MMQRAISVGIGLVALVLSTACASTLSRPGPMVPERDVTRRDSVLTAGRGLVRLVFYIDQYGQKNGSLPPDLAPVLTSYERANEQIRDPWGRHVRFMPRGRSFELQSAGVDRRFDTADDIIVLGQLGRSIPCELRDEDRVLTYEDVAPRCSDLSDK